MNFVEKLVGVLLGGECKHTSKTFCAIEPLGVRFPHIPLTDGDRSHPMRWGGQSDDVLILAVGGAIHWLAVAYKKVPSLHSRLRGIIVAAWQRGYIRYVGTIGIPSARPELWGRGSVDKESVIADCSIDIYHEHELATVTFHATTEL
jgi:hypothetical protein